MRWARQWCSRCAGVPLGLHDVGSVLGAAGLRVVVMRAREAQECHCQGKAEARVSVLQSSTKRPTVLCALSWWKCASASVTLLRTGLWAAVWDCVRGMRGRGREDAGIVRV